MAGAKLWGRLDVAGKGGWGHCLILWRVLHFGLEAGEERGHGLASAADGSFGYSRQGWRGSRLVFDLWGSDVF